MLAFVAVRLGRHSAARTMISGSMPCRGCAQPLLVHEDGAVDELVHHIDREIETLDALQLLQRTRHQGVLQQSRWRRAATAGALQPLRERTQHVFDDCFPGVCQPPLPWCPELGQTMPQSSASACRRRAGRIATRA